MTDYLCHTWIEGTDLYSGAGHGWLTICVIHGLKVQTFTVWQDVDD